MANSFTYKQKFFGVLIGFLVLVLAIYKKTYKHVFAAKQQLELVNEKLQSVDNSSNEIYALKNDVILLDNIIGGQTEEPELVQQMILDFISNSDYKINISSIEDTHIYGDDEFNIYTNIIETEGVYSDLMHLLYKIENEFELSKIVSSELYSVKNYRNNSKRLYLKLIFQNYEKIK